MKQIVNLRNNTVVKRTLTPEESRQRTIDAQEAAIQAEERIRFLEREEKRRMALERLIEKELLNDR